MGRLSFLTMGDRIILVLVGLVFILFCFRLLVESQGRLLPLGTTVDMGSVSVGQTTEKEISIVNSSSKPIEILRWTFTCHCMQARFSQTIVAPHETADAYLRTTALRPLGARAAMLAIQWRYAGEQFVRTDNLITRARYVSDFTLSEEQLNFGVVPSTGGLTKSLEVRSGNSGINCNGLEASSDSSSLALHVLRQEAGFEIQSQIRPVALLAGVWKSQIRIFPLRDGVRTGEEVDVPVVAMIEGPFKVSPSVIQFSSGSAQPLFFSLKIRSQASPMSRLKFVGDLVQNPKITISESGREALLTGVLTTPKQKGAYVGKIPIQVNNDPAEILQVSYLGFAG